MPPASFAPPYNQTLTGKFESVVALAGAHTLIKRLNIPKSVMVTFTILFYMSTYQSSDCGPASENAALNCIQAGGAFVASRES